MGLTVNLPAPHTKQKEVMDHPARFKVLACGRRWGKSSLAILECFQTAVNGGIAWWVAPNYKMTEQPWDMLSEMAYVLPESIRDVQTAKRRVLIRSSAGTGVIRIRSGENPNSLRGESIDLVVYDEAAFGKKKVWTEALRPALGDREGRAIFTSTPNGRNYYYGLFQRGLDPAFFDWQSWQLPTSSNPYIKLEEVASMKLDMSEMEFRQECLAEFLDDNSSVFRGVRRVTGSTLLERGVEGRDYVMGIDWGRSNDFTVYFIIDTQSGSVVNWGRFNQIDYHFQIERLDNAYQRFKPSNVIPEFNSMGQALVEDLERRGWPVSPFTTSNSSKKQIIERLSLAIEKEEIEIPDDEVIVGELMAYESKRLESGLISYGAPSGMHDDTVMALALTWHGVHEVSNRPPLIVMQRTHKVSSFL